MVVRVRRHFPPQTSAINAARAALYALVPPDKAEQLLMLGLNEPVPERRAQYFHSLILGLKHHARLFEPAVGPEEFLFEKRYLSLSRDEVYPKVLSHFIEINTGDYSEAVFTGAIGTAKTTLAVWTNAYQLYLLLLLRNPHREFELERSAEIMLIFQSLSEQLAKRVDYDRFRTLISRSKFFNEDRYTWNKEVKEELQFPRRIFVRPVSGAQTAAIGQNVFGGLLDEVNYMQVIEKSLRSVDAGTYDQATALYDSLSRRRKSRFMKKGRVPGVFCIVSSKRYPGQFTDQKEDEAKREIAKTGRSSIYIYDKRTWEVLPEGDFLGPRFTVFIGDGSRKPRILAEDDDSQYTPETLLNVPVEYRSDFEKDIINALREIGGVSTLARHPYVMNSESISASFGRHKSILSSTETDFKQLRLQLYAKRALFKEQERHVHIDLGLTGDAAGVACGCVPRFVQVKRHNEIETLPFVHFDFTLRVCPPKNDEIPFHRIRSLIYTLCEMGVPVRWITFDSFQSVDSIQIFRQHDFTAWTESMDKTSLPYDVAKAAFYDSRVAAPENLRAVREWLSLERDPKDGQDRSPGSWNKRFGGCHGGGYLRPDLPCGHLGGARHSPL